MSGLVYRGVPIVLLDGIITGTKTIIVPPEFNHGLYIRGNGAVSAGTIITDTAANPEYAGTWFQLASSAVPADSELFVPLTGIFIALRVTISVPVVGGTVKVTYRSEDRG
jgi:pilus assembly protein TadC